MPKKNIGVAIQDTLHADLKSLAAKLGMKIEAAYEDAVRDWLQKNGNQSELIELSGGDISLIREATGLLRSAPSFSQFLQVQVNAFKQIAGEVLAASQAHKVSEVENDQKESAGEGSKVRGIGKTPARHAS